MGRPRQPRTCEELCVRRMSGSGSAPSVSGTPWCYVTHCIYKREESSKHCKASVAAPARCLQVSLRPTHTGHRVRHHRSHVGSDGAHGGRERARQDPSTAPKAALRSARGSRVPASGLLPAPRKAKKAKAMETLACVDPAVLHGEPSRWQAMTAATKPMKSSSEERAYRHVCRHEGLPVSSLGAVATTLPLAFR